MTKLSEDDIFNCVGTTGGVILACALIPQIVLAHKRRSAEDISYMWQAIYTAGLCTLMVYYAHFGLWPVFCPVAVECSCLIYLTLLKAYFERFPDEAAATASQQQSSPLMSGSPGAAGEGTSINGTKQTVGGARRSPKTSKYGAAGYAPAGSPEVAPKV